MLITRAGPGYAPGLARGAIAPRLGVDVGVGVAGPGREADIGGQDSGSRGTSRPGTSTISPTTAASPAATRPTLLQRIRERLTISNKPAGAACAPAALLRAPATRHPPPWACRNTNSC